MPKKTISIPFNRVSIASAPALTGTAMAMHTLRDLFPDGYITNPFRIPDDCDVSRPIDLLAAMRPVVGGFGGVNVLNLQLEVTRVSPGLVGTNLAFLYDYTTPNLWANSDLQQVLLDNGTCISFAGSSFLPTDMAGILFRRNGAAGTDTYPGVVLVADSILFRYSIRCQMCCCP